MQANEEAWCFWRWALLLWEFFAGEMAHGSLITAGDDVSIFTLQILHVFDVIRVRLGLKLRRKLRRKLRKKLRRKLRRKLRVGVNHGLRFGAQKLLVLVEVLLPNRA